MRRSDKQETEREELEERKELRSRERSYRMIGLTAGILTTVVIAAAGYLAIKYVDDRYVSMEPTLPAQVAPVNPSETIGSQEPVKTTGSLTEESSSSVEKESSTEASSEAQSGTREPSSSAVQTTGEEETTQERTTLSPEDQADRELRLKAIEKFTNLGIVVNVNNYLNMRTGPSTEDEICGIIFKNCGVNVLEDAGNGWFRVESGGVTGYVSQDYILQGEEAVEKAVKSCRYLAEIKTDALPVRYEANTSSDVITTVRKGDLYDILSYKGDWIEINAVESLSGYVPISDISASYRLEEAIVFGYDSSVSQLRRDIITKGFQYYGGTYVFGGEDLENGIDCSAYTQQIYGMYGVELYRNSYTQAEQGVKVSEENVRPGDLVFYVGRNPGMVGHVAIYIGNGKILHAASESKGICVSDWKFVPIVTIRNVIGD